MRAILKRYLDTALRRIGFPRLYQIKRMIEHQTKLHHAFVSLFTVYPPILLYFKRRDQERIVFPHNPQQLKMTSKVTQQLYSFYLQNSSSPHAHRH